MWFFHRLAAEKQHTHSKEDFPGTLTSMMTMVVDDNKHYYD